MSTIKRIAKKKAVRRVYETTKKHAKHVVSSTHEPNIPFPVAVLPRVLRNYVREAAEAIGCGAGQIALPLLASVARVICNKRTIRLKTGWTEPAIIWGAVIGESGEHKTPARTAATLFLQHAQKKSQAKNAEKVT